MAKKWLDSIEKQRRRIDFLKKDRYKQTESTTKNSRLLAGAESTDKQTESTTKNSRLLAGAESIIEGRDSEKVTITDST